jgi:hypothetical protein
MSLVNTPHRVSIPRERGVLIYVHLYLGLLGGDGGVPVDELGEHSTQGLNTQGEGSPNMYISTWDFLVGMVVFLLMSLVNTPPRVSIPRERGVTSSKRTSVTSPASTPPRKKNKSN